MNVKLYRVKNLAGLSGARVVEVRTEGASDDGDGIDVITVSLLENRMSFKKGDLLDVYRYELEEVNSGDRT